MYAMQRRFILETDGRCQRLFSTYQRKYLHSNNSNRNDNSNDNVQRFVSPLTGIKQDNPKINSIPQRIIFSSCSSQSTMVQQQLMYWDRMIEQEPDLIILMGDNVYAPKVVTTTTSSIGTNVMSKEYQILGSYPSFVRVATKIPMIATLDDNDYNLKYFDAMKHILSDNERNDGMEQSKCEFLQFFQIPSDDIRWNKDRGVYTSYDYILYKNNTIDIRCSTSNDYLSDNKNILNNPIQFRLQIILLDVRRHRSSFVRQQNPSNMNDNDASYCTGPYTPSHHDSNTKCTMLGSQQWQWLEEQIIHNTMQPQPNVRIIISPIQVLSDGRHGWDCWSLFPHERERLLHLLSQPEKQSHDTIVPKTILLSGDRHVAGYYQHTFKNDIKGTTTTFMEVTSSSLTHSVPHGLLDKEYDTKRIGNFIYTNNFGMIQLSNPIIACDDITQVENIKCNLNIHCAKTGSILHSKTI